MKRPEAEQIVRECIAEKYDRSKFSRLIANLFHSGFAPTSGNVTVLPAYASHVRTCTKIGTATTADNRTAPIYEVIFKGDGSVQNARRKQRDFIASLVEAGQADGALVAFVSEKESDAAWRFSFVTVENRLVQKNGKNVSEKEKTPAKRWSFMVGREERTHTPLSRFVPIVESETVPKFEDVEHAFDVEAVTKEFFNQYKELFLRLKETMDGLFGNDEVLKNHFEALGVSSADFAKKTLGQIVFLYFLQKKGWFGVTKNAAWGSGPKDFLRLAFIRHTEGKFGNKNFFNDVLEPLFYEGLSKDRSSNGQLYDFGNGSEYKIPYLNGGLFEPIAGYDWQATSIPIPDDFFSNSKTRASDGTGVLDVFDLYNFTVNEEEPLEKEVAIDPEMLGKIFENLLEVTDRKSKGAFYTPRPIVHYMCEESLIEYLKTSTKVNEEGIRSLIRQKNLKWDSESDEDFKRRSPQEQGAIRAIVRTIDWKLGEVKIFDPAIGSGAFPMGLLHEIVSIRRYFREHGWIDFKENAPNATKENYAYELKRLAIENSLYGSDIDPGAITVAKLRCWLSLLIDSEEPHPLPNLDFKFVCANALIPLRIRDSLQSQLSTTLQVQMRIFMEFDEKRIGYFWANEARKNALKNELRALQAKLRNLLEQGAQMDDISSEYRDEVMKFVTWDVFWNGSAPFFNQRLMYGIKDGFDIVIGNPPYVQIQKFARTQVQEDLENARYETFDKRSDLYALFYERWLTVSKPNTGILCFITSNKWMRAGYGEKLRGFFAKRNPIKLLDLGGNVFESATVDSNILLIQNAPNVGATLAMTIRDHSADLATQMQDATVTHFSGSSGWFIGSGGEIALKAKIESMGKPLKDWDIQINYGIKTGLNEAFVIDRATRDRLIAEDPKSTEIIKPMLRGRDVKRYGYEFSEQYLIGTFPALHLDIDAYPAIKWHLTQNFDIRQLEQSGKKYPEQGFNARKFSGNKWFETQDNISYCKEFEKEKVVWTDMATRPTFTVLEAGKYFNNTAYMISGWPNYFFVGILNSSLIEWFFPLVSTDLWENGSRYFKQFVELLPIPEITPSNQSAVSEIENLVRQITDIKESDPSADTSVLESQINALVYQLYDLTPKEIAIIEGK